MSRRSVRATIPLLALLLAATASPAGAQVVRQLTHELTTVAGPGAIDDAGTTVWCGASADPAGTNAVHAFQIFRFDPATGTATQLTTAARGVSPLVSVSDDGQWLAFPSPADLTGGNHDLSVELFVMSAGGAQVSQLTSDPAPNAGSVSTVVLAGGGSRVAFVANTDPLGTNAAHRDELFVVNRDGTGLRQLTATSAGAIGGVSISDDGARIVFSHTGDLTGGNADGTSEVFAILSDGTGLRQLTTTPLGYDSGSPSLSGNGSRIAFQSNGDLTGNNAVHQDEIFAIDWAGTGLRQVTKTTTVVSLLGAPASQSPAITDDGVTIFFHSNYGKLFPPVNLDGNYEIFRIRYDGTSLVAITSTALTAGSFFPTVSGAGNRVAYYAIGTGISLAVADGSGGSKRDLVAMSLIFVGGPEVASGGSRVFFTRSTGLFASTQIWRVESDGTGLAQVTSLSSGSASTPSAARDGQTLVFSADSDPVGANADGSEEVFRILADGSGIVQLTSGASGTASQNPRIALDAPVVVFDSDADLVGTNADASREIFKVGADGTGTAQLTNGLAGSTSAGPRIDASGTWVVFASTADLDGGNADGSSEVWRVRADGSGLAPITGDPAFGSGSPDISSAGERIAFASLADPLGTNPEHNAEIFAYEPATAALRQLTVTAVGSSGGPRLSGDGTWVYFSSDSPIFESDPDVPTDLYRVPAGGGAIERIGALRAGALGSVGAISFGGSGGISIGGGSGLVPNADGRKTVFSGIGDFTEENRDALPEVWVVDRDTPPRISVSKESPTIVSWLHESGPLRYDVVRGDLASLRFSAGGGVDLGAVQCLENDSPDATTAGFADPLDPAPGHGFFFVYRGSQGLLAGPGTYGASSDGRERAPSGGDCAR